MMKKIVIVILFFCFSGSVFSQVNEAGIFAGGSNYIGDIGRTNFIYPNSFAFGGIYKWKLHYSALVYAHGGGNELTSQTSS